MIKKEVMLYQPSTLLLKELTFWSVLEKPVKNILLINKNTNMTYLIINKIIEEKSNFHPVVRNLEYHSSFLLDIYFLPYFMLVTNCSTILKS